MHINAIYEKRKNSISISTERLHLEAGNDKDKTFLRDQFALKGLLPLSVSYSKHRTKLLTILRPESALHNFIMKGRDERRSASLGWNTCIAECACTTQPVNGAFGRRKSTGRTIIQIQENIKNKVTQDLKPFAYDELLLPGFESRDFDISSSFEILAVNTESLEWMETDEPIRCSNCLCKNTLMCIHPVKTLPILAPAFIRLNHNKHVVAPGDTSSREHKSTSKMKFVEHFGVCVDDNQSVCQECVDEAVTWVDNTINDTDNEKSLLRFLVRTMQPVAENIGSKRQKLAEIDLVVNRPETSHYFEILYKLLQEGACTIDEMWLIISRDNKVCSKDTHKSRKIDDVVNNLLNLKLEGISFVAAAGGQKNNYGRFNYYTGELVYNGPRGVSIAQVLKDHFMDHSNIENTATQIVNEVKGYGKLLQAQWKMLTEEERTQKSKVSFEEAGKDYLSSDKCKVDMPFTHEMLSHFAEEHIRRTRVSLLTNAIVNTMLTMTTNERSAHFPGNASTAQGLLNAGTKDTLQFNNTIGSADSYGSANMQRHVDNKATAVPYDLIKYVGLKPLMQQVDEAIAIAESDISIMENPDNLCLPLKLPNITFDNLNRKWFVDLIQKARMEDLISVILLIITIYFSLNMLYAIRDASYVILGPDFLETAFNSMAKDADDDTSFTSRDAKRGDPRQDATINKYKDDLKRWVLGNELNIMHIEREASVKETSDIAAELATSVMGMHESTISSSNATVPMVGENLTPNVNGVLHSTMDNFGNGTSMVEGNGNHDRHTIGEEMLHPTAALPTATPRTAYVPIPDALISYSTGAHEQKDTEPPTENDSSLRHEDTEERFSTTTKKSLYTDIQKLLLQA